MGDNQIGYGDLRGHRKGEKQWPVKSKWPDKEGREGGKKGGREKRKGREGRRKEETRQ